MTSGSGGDPPPISDTASRSRSPAATTSSRCGSRATSTASTRSPSPRTPSTSAATSSSNESPTAPDPWPGLDNVGYGTGQGLAGYGLGDDVVRRDHIGALDPATGKALEWDPGSNSFEGNKAMLATPRGLFAGGDATTQGGYNVGRVAFYDFNTHPGGRRRTRPRSSTRSRAGWSRRHAVHVDGTATATSGVQRVQVEIQDRDTRQYLQDDLTTWGAANTINVNLATPERDVDAPGRCR